MKYRIKGYAYLWEDGLEEVSDMDYYLMDMVKTIEADSEEIACQLFERYCQEQHNYECPVDISECVKLEN